MKRAKEILEAMLKGEKQNRWMISAHISELRFLIESEEKYSHLEEEVEWRFDMCHY